MSNSKSALLCYTPSSPSLMTPAAGYTFTWNGYLAGNSYGIRMKNFRMEPIAGRPHRGRDDLRHACGRQGHGDLPGERGGLAQIYHEMGCGLRPAAHLHKETVMQSAFGVDHGDIEKGLFGGGGARAASAGRHAASGLPKIFGAGKGGARKAGAHKGVQGGSRKAGRHAFGR
jgi:hypothetical protein